MTETAVLTLTEFLLARIAEDQSAAIEAGPDGGSWFSRYPEQADCHMYGDFGWVVSGPDVETEDSEWGKAVADHIAGHDPARVLAECEAKRQIVKMYVRARDARNQSVMERVVLQGALQELAAPYADHPDYREEWKP